MNVRDLLQVLGASGQAAAGAQSAIKPTAGQKLDPLQASVSNQTPVYAGTPAVGASADAPPAQNIQVSIAPMDFAPQVERLADLVTTGLGQPSGALRAAYETALNKLSPALRQKDWTFSVSHGQLIFKAGNDPLSAQDRIDLQNAFAGTGAAQAATEVANVVVATIQLQSHMGQEFGVDPGTGKYDVNQNNFANIVDLRSYLMSSAPGGEYYNNPSPSTSYSTIYSFSGWYAMQDQIELRAPVRYSQT